MTTDPMPVPATPGRRILAGGVRVFLAESLIVPTGLITAAYLARRLGPEGYGVFTVAAAVVAWMEWGITAVFSRASVRFVADAEDWRPIGSTIVSVHLTLAVAAAALLWALAVPLASLLETPALAGPLRLFSLDIPLFCLAQAHRNILIGIGHFGERAMAAAARWISRLLLVLLLVEAGLSVDGAILGSIGASVVELAVCRWYVRPTFSVPAARRIGTLWSYVAPLLLSAIALRLYDRLDLLALSALGGTAEQAGQYGAAQNLAILPNLLALSFAPLLLATLTRAFRDGDLASAGRMGRESLRGALLLVPFAALGAGAAPEVVALVFGSAFAPAAGPLPPLLFAAVALVVVSVSTAILVAAGRPRLTATVTVPLPLAAALGYLAIIPRFGPRGAAFVTLVCAVLAAVTLLVIVHRVCRILPPALTVTRSGLIAGGAYAAAALWPASGAAVLLELGVIALGIVLVLAASGELTASELSAARSWGLRKASRAS